MSAPRSRILMFLALAATLLTQGPASARSAVVQTFVLPASIGNLTEPALAVDPRDPRRMHVLAADYAGSVTTVAGEQVRVAPTCRSSRSTDAGRSWVSEDFAGSHVPAVPYVSASNPSLATDTRGNVYAACLANNGSAGGAVVFAKGVIGSSLGSSQLLSTPGAGPILTADKPWVATTPDGASVAVVWAEFLSSPGTSVIVARVSHDHGVTFGAPYVVSGPTAGGEVLAASGLPCAVFLRSGKLAVAWHASLANGGDVMAVVMDGTATSPQSSIALRDVALSGVQGRYPRHANQPSLALDPTGDGVLLAGGVQAGGGVRAALVRVDAAGHVGRRELPVPAPSGTDELNAAVGTTPQGTVGLVLQQVRSGRLTTLMALRGRGAVAWRPLVVSSTTTPVAPYTATSSGTPIGDFLMVVAAGPRLVCVFPEQRGDRLQLRGVVVVAS